MISTVFNIDAPGIDDVEEVLLDLDQDNDGILNFEEFKNLYIQVL